MPQFGGAAEKCNVCNKTVYLAEKIVVEDKDDKKTFHKTCLKCSHCKATLSLGNYASMNGVMYCKPHFKQLFATKGNYDEGFGKDKLTSKWSPNPGATSAPSAGTFVPVEKTDEGKSKEKKETPSNIAARFSKSVEKCDACSKSVYATEKIVVEEKDDKKVYHKQCLKCSHCAVILTLGSYASMNGVMYCKPHFKQLFAAKGNYDEGFGKDKATAKWDPQGSSAPTSFVPVEKSEVTKEKTAAPNEIANKFKNISVADKCSSCGKTVYLTEKVVVEDKDDKKLFHKQCLRCSHCQVVLSLGNYASMNGIMYCKPHFKQLFATKGNYDEGFGKEKHSAKWIEQDAAGPESSTTTTTTTHSDEHEHEHKHDDGTVHSHEHKHGDEHSHDHSHEHKHDDGHEHKHDDGTVHSHEHKHGDEHSHDHSHEHKHDDHSHEHKHDDGTVHSHEHKHGDEHEHNKEHEHKHDDHEHSHEHEHKHDDGTVHSHEHSHDDHEHKHDDHEDSHEHKHEGEQSHE